MRWWGLWCALTACFPVRATIHQAGKADRRLYVGIAAPPSAVAAVRAFNQSLAQLATSYAGELPAHLRNITLQPLYFELPEDMRFRVKLMEGVCGAVGGRRVAALLVVGGGSAAAAVVLAAARAGVPVLRASQGHLSFHHALAENLLPLEVRLEITARETLHALRATLLYTHWHKFTLLSETDIHVKLTLRKDLSSILTTPPLSPKMFSLPEKYSRHALFRRLAEVSRLSRGVVILICDVNYVKLVMDEAKRLNMLDGHFFWLWIDATTSFDVYFDKEAKTINEKADEPESERARDKGGTSQNIQREKRNVTMENDNNSATTADEFQELFLKRESFLNSEKITKTNSRRELLRNDLIDRIKKTIGSVRTQNTSRSSKLYSNNKYNSNVNIVQSESVEDSKMVNKFGETALVSDNRKLNILKNLSFAYNKYIDLTRSIIDDMNSKETDTDYKRQILLSNTSEVLMNPKVQYFLSNSLREVPQKRKDKGVIEKQRNVENNTSTTNFTAIFNSLPVGLIALNPQPSKIGSAWVRYALYLAAAALRRVLRACDAYSVQAQFLVDGAASCWEEASDASAEFSAEFVREMRESAIACLAGLSDKPDNPLTAKFGLYNLVPNSEQGNLWQPIGKIIGRTVSFHTIVWPGGRLVAQGLSSGARSVFRIVTSPAPPFVMAGELDEDGQCLRGVPCHRPKTKDKDNLTLVFTEIEYDKEHEDDRSDYIYSSQDTSEKFSTFCCYGLAMDLLENVAVELEFDFHLYVVEDGLYGTRKLVKNYKRLNKYAKNSYTSNKPHYRMTQSYNTYTYIDSEFIDDLEKENENVDPESEKWNGIIGDLISGAADMSFGALSVSSARAEVIDFSQPFFYSGVSLLAAPTQRSEIPLLAFLLPFSPELWIAIFTSLNVTAIAVAIYEWLSPFGLNPWGRQRSKNFSISSALWVMWGLLCGHLVAFKAPKSWPNKFLINVWGGFSVIFVASYTANIAALIAGLFFHNAVDNYQGKNWLSLRVGVPRASAPEYYIQRSNPALAEHMKRYIVQNVEEGINRLRNGTLDLLIADTPILDYYRATDHGCTLQRIGDQSLAQDTYAVGMKKGFPLKDSISALISKYSSNGYMDILTEKWYGGLPCFKHSSDYGVQPQPLGVAAVAGVFLLLGVGMLVGCLILVVEHLFYKYTLPVLRHQPKGTIWRSRNIMFFSQKLYRFINCVELVSPHHAARELVHTLRQGQITSLFQKSVKRKEHEQRRRRKSKAQFFEMIQEIRRQQSREKPLEPITESGTAQASCPVESVELGRLTAASPDSRKRSPRQTRSPRSPKNKHKRRSSNLNVRRFSTDSILGSDSSSFFERTSFNIGRRLSRDVSCLNASPPDINTRLRSPSPLRLRCNDDRPSQSSENSSTTKTGVEIFVTEPPNKTAALLQGKTASCLGGSQLSRLPEEELMRLWHSSESEVRDALLSAIEERRNVLPEPDPG